MAKPDFPKGEKRQISRLTHVEWECPFCQRANGVPEIDVCACGAVRHGAVVTSAADLTVAVVVVTDDSAE